MRLKGQSSAMEKNSHLSPLSESFSSPLTFSDSLSPSRSSNSRRDAPVLRQPWRHSVSRTGPLPVSRTVREFRPNRQRRRLFAQGFSQWLITCFLCGLLAACLATFGQLAYMSVHQVKAFNALIVLLSLFLGINLASSFKEMALMLRWRILAAKYRSLDEFDLIMHGESLKKVLKLTWVAKTPGQAWFWFNKTQWVCLVWVGVNIMLQILVALLGLTYNLNTSTLPARIFGQISIANFTIVDDPWTNTSPEFDSQLGSANIYGSQSQYYAYALHEPQSGSVATYGRPSTPTIYYNEDYTTFSYTFQDSNPDNPDLTLRSYRNISTSATCTRLQVLEGGNGSSSIITYLDQGNVQRTLNVARVGPGAMTYVGVLNSTCGTRCSEILALQSANGDTIPTPSFYRCINVMTPILGIGQYLYGNMTAELFQVPDLQSRIFAGAIGWTGFNFTPGDAFQYVRYPTQSWWSPDFPANETRIAMNIMEYSIGAVASFDYNGPRSNVTGYYPVPAQEVDIQWRWSGAILGVIPVVHLVALLCVILWGNSAIIRDTSCLSTAKLLRPIVDKLGDNGCLLSGEEIAEELPDLRVKYGWREPASNLVFRNEIDDHTVRHVDILEEDEGFGLQGVMPPGRYDGLGYDEKHNERSSLLHHRRARRSMSM